MKALIPRRRLPRWLLPFMLGLALAVVGTLPVFNWLIEELNAARLQVFHLSSIPPLTETRSAPELPTFQQIAVGAADDAEILDRISLYFEENRERLAARWETDNRDRLVGIFSMYMAHISQPYGEVDAFPETLEQFISQERGHCGTYTFAQSHIVTALGVEWRSVEFVAEHAWIEVRVDGEWELFDATTNIWINRGIEALLAGEEREFREFYTPMLDVARPDARLHIEEGYNMQRLRQRMPLLGIQYMPPGEMRIGYPESA
jgi:hypothetical protein